MAKRETLQARLELRGTKEEIQRIKDAADEAGQTTSKWLRQVCERYLRGKARSQARSASA
jgi:uncharacterized protein (DUF1778 family)